MDENEADYKLAMLEFNKAKEQLDKIIRQNNSTPPYCSFCQRGKGQYLFCIEGRSEVRICESCVLEAYQLIVNELQDKPPEN